MADYSISAEGYLGIGTEATFGTAVSVTKYIPILSESIVATTGGIFPDDIRGDRDRHTVLEGPFGVSGDIEFLAGPENGLGQMLFGALGSCSTAGTAAPYTHTFEGASALPSYTVDISVGDTMVRQISGVKVGTLAFSQGAGEPLSVTATLVGANESISTTIGTPSISTLEPYKFSEARVTIGGTADVNVENIDFTIENTLVTDFRTLNRKRQVQKLPEGRRVITGTMDLNFNDWTEYRRFLGNATVPQTTPWTGSLKFEWVRTNKNFTVELPKVRWSAESANISGADRVIEGIEFDALYHATAGSAISVVLTNTESSY